METIYEIIGRCVERNNLRYFNELKGEMGYEDPILSNTSLLPHLKVLFCDIKNISPERLCSRDHDRHASYTRSICIAVMYKLYSPNCINPLIRKRSNRAFNSELCTLLNINKKKYGAKCQNALFSYANYQHFARSVNDIYTELKKRLRAEGVIPSE